MQKAPHSLLDPILAFASSPQSAYKSTGGSLSYRQLIQDALTLADSIRDDEQNLAGLKGVRYPVILRGDKEPEMIIGILACVMSGHPYVPMLNSTPSARFGSILNQLVEEFGFVEILTPEKIRSRLSALAKIHWRGSIKRSIRASSENDCLYILFTSGSTGSPKGIKISIGNVVNFVQWLRDRQGFRPGREVFINQAPFSFDLSVIELWCGLTTGSTIFTIPHALIEAPALIPMRLQRSNGTIWVSTPSFVRLCLRFSRFDQTLLPELTTFLFCGETLPHETVRLLRLRFPSADIFNLYGPTETTCAVTMTMIGDADLSTYESLPVGFPCTNTTITLNPDRTLRISGAAVGLGYLGDHPGFSVDENGVRSFDTGDVGYIDNDGMVFVFGRNDSQVKVNGFRIDLLEIRSALTRIEGVFDAHIYVNSLNHIIAEVILSDLSLSTDFILGGLMAYLPDYMIPSRIDLVSAFKLTDNGKYAWNQEGSR